MEKLTKHITKEKLPEHVIFEVQENLREKVIQFGEGNFLRAFVKLDDSRDEQTRIIQRKSSSCSTNRAWFNSNAK
ncbi:MAG: hypothetical protein LRY71_09630 [Bacillaceae bacterium]|nr:hypothetical protein [Bacillaceae bacterium]